MSAFPLAALHSKCRAARSDTRKGTPAVNTAAIVTANLETAQRPEQKLYSPAQLFTAVAQVSCVSAAMVYPWAATDRGVSNATDDPGHRWPALLLVGAGVAVAHGFDSKAVKQVSATFTATTASNSEDFDVHRRGRLLREVGRDVHRRGRQLASRHSTARPGSRPRASSTRRPASAPSGATPASTRPTAAHLVQLRGRAHARLGGRSRRRAAPARRRGQAAGEPLGRLQRGRRLRERQARRRHRCRRRRPDHPGRMPSAQAAAARAREGARRDHGGLAVRRSASPASPAPSRRTCRARSRS